MNFTLEHSLEILEICLNQTESAVDRKIAFMDANRDLHLSPVHKRVKYNFLPPGYYQTCSNDRFFSLE